MIPIAFNHLERGTVLIFHALSENQDRHNKTLLSPYLIDAFSGKILKTERSVTYIFLSLLKWTRKKCMTLLTGFELNIEQYSLLTALYE